MFSIDIWLRFRHGDLEEFLPLAVRHNRNSATWCFQAGPRPYILYNATSGFNIDIRYSVQAGNSTSGHPKKSNADIEVRDSEIFAAMVPVDPNLSEGYSQMTSKMLRVYTV